MSGSAGRFAASGQLVKGSNGPKVTAAIKGGLRTFAANASANNSLAENGLYA